MALAPAAVCPHCGAARAADLECPRCGVIYAKARPPPAPPPPPPLDLVDVDPTGDEPWLAPPVRWMGAVEDARRELLVRAVAPPVALAIAYLVVASHAGHALLRTFLSMWVHESGHAVTAWLCGYAAFPGPWRTPVSSARHAVVMLAVAIAFAALAWRAWSTRRGALLVAAASGLLAQLVCSLLPASTAQALVIFGGDAGCMVLGAALVATIWTDPEGPLGKGALRWGFLAIGAAALVDALETWVRAWRDPGELPLGEIEGVGLSDASRLMEIHRWSASALSGRYVALGLLCLAALAAGYAVAVARARARVRTAEADVAGGSRLGSDGSP